MSDSSLENLPKGWKSVPSDLGSDQTAFKGVQWGKAMMWIFLLSCLLYTSPSPRD